MHQNCYELLKSERYNEDNPQHIIMMDKLNSKTLTQDELSK